MKKLSLNLMLLFGLTLFLTGQSSNKLFIGLQPDITREIKNNDQKVFSVNVVPLVAKYYMNDEIAFRLTTIVNLQSDTKEISNLGASYFTAQDEAHGSNEGLSNSLGLYWGFGKLMKQDLIFSPFVHQDWSPMNVVLTDRLTISASERVVMILNTLPDVTIMGDTTNGAISTKISKELANGWNYSVAPQHVEFIDGINYEGTGMPPDVFMKNTEEEILNGQDRVLEEALARFK